jgi:GTP-binding protein LepA
MGDTITDARNPSRRAAGLQGDSSDGVQRHLSHQHGGLRALKSSMGKLKLNDSAFVYSSETSVALGFGFRCGFLGLLHLEIVQERLRREYDMDIIATYPSVVYRVTLTDGTHEAGGQSRVHAGRDLHRKNRGADGEGVRDLPERKHRRHDGAHFRKARRVDHTETLDAKRVMLTSLIPLNEILIDFHDRIKSITRGFGSMDYEPADYQEATW